MFDFPVQSTLVYEVHPEMSIHPLCIRSSLPHELRSCSRTRFRTFILTRFLRIPSEVVLVSRTWVLNDLGSRHKV